MAKVSSTQAGAAWHRWFRRSNVYTAEYILMLIFMASLLGVLSSLWQSFFSLLSHSDYSAVALAKSAAMQLGALVVVGPAAYWLYARVTGQEMIEPNLFQRKSRTVFLTLWVIGVTLALVAVIGSAMSALALAVFGLGDMSAKELWLDTVLPDIFVAATLGFGLAMVVKHVSRMFVLKTASLVVAVAAVVLLVANLSMILVRKDIKQPQIKSDCTFSHYLSGGCNYQDYRNQVLQNRGMQDSTNSAPTMSFPNLFN